ncbi:DUF4157 domain-containing protein [Pseudomonas sp. CR3202]|uniref:eCIS core domain-containing protein n=1 Tax=Pseudomonas sp. CR3202 TaxID=3351532 RepID=UPI003BEFA0A7
MPAVPPRALLRQAVLALSFLSTAALACPTGQTKVCVVSCFCAPGSQSDMAPLLESVNQMAATSLQQWIVESRNNMDASRLQPIPLHIRAQLEPWYDLRVLDTARYKVGVDEEMNAANTLMQNPDVEAVTLVDVIVFRNEDDAENNVALWAHELHHVKQYQEWGVAGFAQRYTRDYNIVEAPAYKIQAEVRRALKPTMASSAP